MKNIKKDTIREQVYEKIKRIIQDGIIVPGEKLNKKELIETLAVSQTPVNEAINRLVGEGILEQRTMQGFYIRNFTYEDMKELFAVRASLEGICIRLCIEELPKEYLNELSDFFKDFTLPITGKELDRYRKIDAIFHKKIVTLSGNSIIIGFDNTFNFILKSYQKGLIRSPEETLDEHLNLIKAIKSGNSKKAQELLTQHFLKSRARIIKKYLQNNE